MYSNRSMQLPVKLARYVYLRCCNTINFWPDVFTLPGEYVRFSLVRFFMLYPDLESKPQPSRPRPRTWPPRPRTMSRPMSIWFAVQSKLQNTDVYCRAGND